MAGRVRLYFCKAGTRTGYLDRRGGNHGPQWLLLGDPRDRAGEGDAILSIR